MEDTEEYFKQVKKAIHWRDLKACLSCGKQLYQITIDGKHVGVYEAVDFGMLGAVLRDVYIMKDDNNLVGKFSRSHCLDYSIGNRASNISIEHRVDAINDAVTTSDKLLRLQELRLGIGVGEEFFVKDLLDGDGASRKARCVVDATGLSLGYQAFNKKGVLLKKIYPMPLSGKYADNYEPRVSPSPICD